MKTFDDYREALKSAGPKLKELILDRAAHDSETIGFPEFVQLCEIAYPELP